MQGLVVMGARITGEQIIFQVRRDRRCRLRCAKCGGLEVTTRGTRRKPRRLRDLPFGRLRTILEVEVLRVRCETCGDERHAAIPGMRPSQRQTERMENYIGGLCLYMAASQAAEVLGLPETTVRRIDKAYLRRSFGKPNLDGVRVIALDEVAIAKGQKYFTILMNLLTGDVLGIAEGRDEGAIRGLFQQFTEEQRKRIVAAAMDMAPAIRNAVEEMCPNAKIVYDHFHLAQMLSKVVDEIRRKERNKARGPGNDVLKGTRYLLLRRHRDLKQRGRQQLKELLAVNKPISEAYVLKEDFAVLWQNVSRQDTLIARVARFMHRAYQASSKLLHKFADSLEAHIDGIVNWLEYPISTARLECLNRDIGLVRKRAHGYRDLDYFRLKIVQVAANRTPPMLQAG